MFLAIETLGKTCGASIPGHKDGHMGRRAETT